MFFDEKQLNSDLEKILQKFKTDLKNVRTGKADVEAFNNIQVEAYGDQVPLVSVGNIIKKDAMTILVKVWDKNNIETVEKALRQLDVGGNVSSQSEGVYVTFAPITEEDRREKVKEVGKMAEATRVRIRKEVRQEYMEDIEKLEGVSEDDQARDKDQVEKIVASYIKKVDELFDQKEKELLPND